MAEVFAYILLPVCVYFSFYLPAPSSLSIFIYLSLYPPLDLLPLYLSFTLPFIRLYEFLILSLYDNYSLICLYCLLYYLSPTMYFPFLPMFPYFLPSPSLPFLLLIIHKFNFHGESQIIEIENFGSRRPKERSPKTEANQRPER